MHLLCNMSQESNTPAQNCNKLSHKELARKECQTERASLLSSRLGWAFTQMLWHDPYLRACRRTAIEAAFNSLTPKSSGLSTELATRHNAAEVCKIPLLPFLDPSMTGEGLIACGSSDKRWRSSSSNCNTCETNLISSELQKCSLMLVRLEG